MARGVLIRMSSSYIIWPGGGGGGGGECYPKCFYHTHMTLKCGTCKSMIHNDTWGHNIWLLTHNYLQVKSETKATNFFF